MKQKVTEKGVARYKMKIKYEDMNDEEIRGLLWSFQYSPMNGEGLK